MQMHISIIANFVNPSAIQRFEEHSAPLGA